MQKKHLFFDMDGTLTMSRSLIDQPMYDALEKLLETYTIGVTSGSHNDQMFEQLKQLPIIRMGQNGNHCIHPTDGELWNDIIGEEEKVEILAHAEKLLELVTWDVPDEDDLLEDRGSQISFSIYGNHANADMKRTIDPNFSKRRAMIEQVPFVSDIVDVKIAGSTCFDYFKKGRNKGYNITRLIERNGWDKDDCVYYGDALFPGGNDETVVGIIDTIEVKDDKDTLAKLQELL